MIKNDKLRIQSKKLEILTWKKPQRAYHRCSTLRSDFSKAWFATEMKQCQLANQSCCSRESLVGSLAFFHFSTEVSKCCIPTGGVGSK